MKSIMISILLIIGSFTIVFGYDNVITLDADKNNDSTAISSNTLTGWGKGVFFESQMISSQQIELGFGYGIGLGGNLPLRRPHTGKAKGGRLGIAVGLKYFNDELVYDPDTSLFYYSDAWGPYLRLAYGSPILRNLMSVSTHFKAMYLWRLSGADGRLAKDEWGFGVGGNVSFWLYENMSVDLGMTLEGTKSEPLSNIIPVYNRPLLQRKFRAQFGITVYF